MKATNNNGIKYSLGYDSYGNMNSMKVENPEKTTKYIETKTTYTSNGNYVSKTENQLGGQTSYTYASNKGTISSVTDPKGNKVNYTYDNLDRLTNTKLIDGQKTYQNTYTYENDKIKTVNNGGTTYSFSYDKFGNQKQVKVGNQVLVENEYITNNGNLLWTNYGNGQSRYYLYDRFNRLWDNTGFRYTYDGRGNIATIKYSQEISLKFRINKFRR